MLQKVIGYLNRFNHGDSLKFFRELDIVKYQPQLITRFNETYMTDNANQLKAEWLQGKLKIGMTTGASAPEILVQEVVSKLADLVSWM